MIFLLNYSPACTKMMDSCSQVENEVQVKEKEKQNGRTPWKRGAEVNLGIEKTHKNISSQMKKPNESDSSPKNKLLSLKK